MNPWPILVTFSTPCLCNLCPWHHQYPITLQDMLPWLQRTCKQLIAFGLWWKTESLHIKDGSTIVQWNVYAWLCLIWLLFSLLILQHMMWPWIQRIKLKVDWLKGPILFGIMQHRYHPMIAFPLTFSPPLHTKQSHFFINIKTLMRYRRNR